MKKKKVLEIVGDITKELVKNRFKNKLLIIAGPSGVGKSTVVKELVKIKKFSKVKTTTTRNMRDGETLNDYNFTTINKFSKGIENGEYLEWEEVYDGVYYGSSYEETEKIWNEYKLPVIITDVKGALKLKEKLSEECLSVFLEADKDIIVERLMKRKSESYDSLDKRIKRMDMEFSLKNNFDLIIDCNGSVESSVYKIKRGMEKIIYPFGEL